MIRFYRIPSVIITALVYTLVVYTRTVQSMSNNVAFLLFFLFQSFDFLSEISFPSNKDIFSYALSLIITGETEKKTEWFVMQ